MALIKCPECGTEVSDKAKACIKCGYPLSDNNSNQENVPDETAIKDEVIKSVAPSKVQSKINTKTLIIIAVCLIAVAGIVVLSIVMSRPALPYGLSPSMGEDEVKKAMRESGFTFDFVDSNHVFFKSKTIYGVRTDYTSVIYDWQGESEYIAVWHRYGKLDNDQYAKVLDGATKEYGTPQKKYGGGYEWKKGKVEITLDEVTDTNLFLQITFRDFH